MAVKSYYHGSIDNVVFYRMLPNINLGNGQCLII